MKSVQQFLSSLSIALKVIQSCSSRWIKICSKLETGKITRVFDSTRSSTRFILHANNLPREDKDSLRSVIQNQFS